MPDEKPEEETEVTPEGAVEIDDKDLDQAAGGTDASIYFNKRSLEGTTREDPLPPPVAPERGG